METSRSKTVQVEFFPDGSAEVTFFRGDDVVKGKTKRFQTVPKRLAFFLDKFGESDWSDKEESAKSSPDPTGESTVKGETNEE